jgi:hypothetical protein
MNGMRYVGNARWTFGPLLATAAAVLFLSFFAGDARAAIVFGAAAADVGVLDDLSQSVCVADLDGDGRCDVIAVVRAGSGFDIVAWKNDGAPFSGGAWPRCTIGTLADWAYSIVAADLDGDGFADLVAGAGTLESHNVVVYENDGTPFDGPWPRHDIGSSGGPQYTSVAAGDLDNDGRIDIVSVGGGGGGSIGTVRAWRNGGTPFAGLWTGGEIFSATDVGMGLALADLDADGYLDVVANHGQTSIGAFRNDGTPFDGGWTENLVGTACAAFPRGVLASDLDGDGYADLVTMCGSSPTSTQTAWRNDGTPFDDPWESAAIGTAAAAAASAGDFNFDGRADIAMVTYLGEVLVWENGGTPFSGPWTRRDVGAMVPASLSLATGDLDGDGDLDIVTVGVENAVLAWENLAAATITLLPDLAVTGCTGRSVEVHIDHEEEILGDVRGYEVAFSIDTTVVRIASPSLDIGEGAFMSSGGGASQFYVTSEGGGAYVVSCAVLGGDAGGRGHAALFDVFLTPAAEGVAALTITSVKLRDLINHPLPVGWAGGAIRVDCTAPTMEPIAEPGLAWYNHAPAFAVFGFDDDVDLDRAEYRVDAGPWTEIFSGIDGAAWDGDGWTLPGFAALSEGTHTVFFRVEDDAGNWNGEGGSQPDLYRWQFLKDTTPPPAPTGFAAAPGHDKTHLSWRNPAGDPTFAGVEIRFNRWNGYPRYGPPTPSYPASHAQGTLVTLTTAEAYDDSPRTPRDIYYYTAFSKDLAGNYSTYTSGAAGRATSYWLGDFDPDGRVYTNDLVILSAAFGRRPGQPGWNDLCDVGPTNDYSRFGIPLPDTKINFEDLMIFSMNWDAVTPLGLGGFVAGGAPEDLADLVRVEASAGDEGVISIVLENRASTLKGIHIVADVAGAELVSVDRGALFDGPERLFFGVVPGESSTADFCAAALGTDVPLGVSGELARLVVRRTAAGRAVVTIRELDCRDLQNGRYEIVASGPSGTPFIPNVSALLQNYPNPFNPATEIVFDLARASAVTIQVFDVSGRLVATPVNGPVAAGRHRVAWIGTDARGRDVPSGIYFYRMRASGYEATRKMILVR